MKAFEDFTKEKIIFWNPRTRKSLQKSFLKKKIM